MLAVVAVLPLVPFHRLLLDRLSAGAKAAQEIRGPTLLFEVFVGLFAMVLVALAALHLAVLVDMAHCLIVVSRRYDRS